MTDVVFPGFPPEARVWIHTTDRPLDDGEWERVQDRIRPFFERWTSHRREVRGSVELWDRRFVVMAAWVPDGDISGCGIDKSVHEIEAMAGFHAFSWLPTLDVVWREGPDIRAAPRAEFRKAVLDGRVTSSTPVFDRSVTTVAAVRDGRFERPAGDSWLTRIFRIPAPRS